MLTFTALDFETANSDRASACSIGLAVVRSGIIVEEFHSLIKPPQLVFDPWNVRKHRITAEDVANAPPFPALLPSLLQLIEGPLVAHNASFDMSVLRACLNLDPQDLPALPYCCSLKLAQASWPDVASHALSEMSRFLGISLHNHHHALDDARACAEIVLRVPRSGERQSLHEMASDLGIELGEIRTDGYMPCRGGTPRSARRPLQAPRSQEAQSESVRLSGVVFLFTGELRTLSRSSAESLVRAHGGEVVANISRRVQCVVVGREPGVKLERAQTLHASGSPLSFLTEDDFLALIEG